MDVPALQGRKITNNIRRGIGIIYLNEALVRIDKGMETIGYRTMNVFKKYNQEKNFFPNVPLRRRFWGRLELGGCCFILMPIN
jgi:hypothetical protein